MALLYLPCTFYMVLAVGAVILYTHHLGVILLKMTSMTEVELQATNVFKHDTISILFQATMFQKTEFH